MMETTRLVLSARTGDRAALDALCLRHQGRLLALIRLRLSPELAASLAPEDLLQETLLEAARKVGAFEPQGPAAFYRWLVGIARFKIAEAERARRALKRALVGELHDDPAESQTSPSGRAQRDERDGRLRHAVAALPPRQADAVRLRYLEARSLAETAAELQCTEAAVKALVSRGLSELAQGLDPTGF